MSQQTAASASTTMDALRGNAGAVANATEKATTIGFYDGPSYALLRTIAKDFATSDMVPARYQRNAPNCMIAVNMAIRMMADPLMVMQNLYVVHGTPGWSSQFLIACFNQCGRFESIHYKFTGEKNTDTWGCIAYAKEKSTGEIIEGSEVTIGIAKKEGWYGKNGSKWQTMPQQMLMYRAAAWMIRTHAPEIGMGFQTREEVEDAIEMAPDQNGVFRVSSDEIAAQAAAREASVKESSPKTMAKTQAGKPKPEPATAEQDKPAMPETSGPMIKCPDTGKDVPETDCPACGMRKGCPAWAD